ncbi:unnamed protein product, partial [Didymodactylos carnosus]
MVKESRRELFSLQKSYRRLATNPSPDDFVLMDNIHNQIRENLEKKALAKSPGKHERNVKDLSLIAKTAMTSTKASQARIPFLLQPTKGKVESSSEMLTVATDFYTELYSEKPADSGVWNRFLTVLPKLSPQNVDKLEKEITVVECYDALKEMTTGRSPGDDGITGDVWRVIFPIIGEYYVKMI